MNVQDLLKFQKKNKEALEEAYKSYKGEKNFNDWCLILYQQITEGIIPIGTFSMKIREVKNGTKEINK